LFNNRMSGTTSRKEKEKVTKVWHLWSEDYNTNHEHVHNNGRENDK
jgi:hypothetical protein